MEVKWLRSVFVSKGLGERLTVAVSYEPPNRGEGENVKEVPEKVKKWAEGLQVQIDNLLND